MQTLMAGVVLPKEKSPSAPAIYCVAVRFFGNRLLAVRYQIFYLEDQCQPQLRKVGSTLLRNQQLAKNDHSDCSLYSCLFPELKSANDDLFTKVCS